MDHTTYVKQVSRRGLSYAAREPVNAKPGLKLNNITEISLLLSFFFLHKIFLTTYVKDKQKKQKISPKTYKTEIKIFPNPALA